MRSRLNFQLARKVVSKKSGKTTVALWLKGFVSRYCKVGDKHALVASAAYPIQLGFKAGGHLSKPLRIAGGAIAARAFEALAAFAILIYLNRLKALC